MSDLVIGQLWQSTDKRRPVVGRITFLDSGFATIDCNDAGTRRVRLDRLRPKNGWRLAEENGASRSIVQPVPQPATAATDALSAHTRSLSPAVLAEQIRGKSIDELAAIFAEARELGARAWQTLALCVSAAQAQAGYGDDILESLAKTFEVHRATVATLGQIGREILEPRIAEQGEAVSLPLSQQSWYSLACRAAKQLAKPAVEVLAQAEERISEPGFSARKWQRELGLSENNGDEGSTSSQQGSVGRALGKLAKLEDDVIDEWVEHADVRNAIRMAEEAYSAVDRAVTGLRERVKGKRT